MNRNHRRPVPVQAPASAPVALDAGATEAGTPADGARVVTANSTGHRDGNAGSVCAHGPWTVTNHGTGTTNPQSSPRSTHDVRRRDGRTTRPTTVLGRATALLALIMSLGVANTQRAGAAPQSQVTVAPTVGPPTTTIEVSATGFVSDEVVSVQFDDTAAGTVIAQGPTGSVEITVEVPASAGPGDHTVTARGLTSGVTSAASFLVRTDWTQSHFDAAKTGWNRFENLLSPGTVNGIIIVNSIIINGRHPAQNAVTSSPITCNGTVFVGDEAGNIYGMEDPDEYPWSLPTGVEDPDEYPWVFPTRGAIVGSPAAIPPANPPDGCTIVAASMDGHLYALDGGSGGMLWSANVGAAISASPLVAGNPNIIGNPNIVGDPHIVVGDVAGRLHAFDTNGNRAWTTQLDGPITAGAAHLTAAPAADVPGGLQLDPGDRIYVGTQRGTLYTLNPRDGSVAAATTLDGPIVSTPAVIRDFDPQPDPPKVYVGTTNGTLYALYADDLSELWSLPLGGPITGTPAIGNPHITGDSHLAIFAPSGDGTLYALDEINGRPETLWTTPLGAAIATSPTLANGVIYLAADDSKLRALDATTGWEVFTSNDTTGTMSSPIVADGTVLVGTTHGELLAFGLPAQA